MKSKNIVITPNKNLTKFNPTKLPSSPFIVSKTSYIIENTPPIISQITLKILHPFVLFL